MPQKNAAVICGASRDPAMRGIPGVVENEPCYDGKRISTRRFCGSRTPGGVGTRKSLKL